MLGKLAASSAVAVATSVAHFANDVCVTLLPAVLPILVREFDLSYAAAGALITASALLMTSLQAVTGYFADRWNRITLLLIGLITLGVGTILLSFSANYVQLVAFACLVGIGGSVFHPIGYSLLSDAFESGNRGKALGLGSAAGDIAIPVAFATSGFLVLFLGWRNLFVLWGIVVIIAALTLPLMMKDPEKSDVRPKVTGNSTPKIIGALIPVIVVMGFASAAYRIASSFTTTYLTSFGLTIESANFVLALMMVGGTIGSLIGGTLTDRLGEKNTVTAEMVVLGILAMVFVCISNVYFLVLVICLIGFFLLSVWPPFYSVIAGATNLGARAFTYGVIFAIAWSFGSVFPYLSGAFADMFGLQVIYILIGALSLIGAFTVYFTFRK